MNHTVSRIKDDIEHGNKHALFHVVNHEVIHFGQNFAGILVAASLQSEGCADHGHDE